ncbi:MAG: hypothetical protein HFF11_05440 [Angelakisella sp.]|jgi:hypothetical protein|nr:hypothetical protein [Angelakisella sp.]
MDEIIFLDTPERYRPMAAEIVPPLLALLRERSALEEEIWNRLNSLRKEFAAGGGSPNQLPPGSLQVCEEYQRRYQELAASRCIPGFLKNSGPISCARPGKYSFLGSGSGEPVTFTMKTARKAVVVTGCPRSSLRFLYRFTLRPGPEGWLIAKIEYHHSNETSWHMDHDL